jgi:hypothetical protein
MDVGSGGFRGIAIWAKPGNPHQKWYDRNDM